MLQRAIVVGASSGIGAELVLQLAKSGYRVVALARSAEPLNQLAEQCNASETRVYPLVHDVTELSTVNAAFDQAVSLLDGLDVVLYAAGILPRIGLTDFDTPTDAQVIQVNLVGAMAWLNLAAQRFQVQGSGCLVGIGSVAGDRGRRGNPAYGASKAALHSYLESLRNRLARQGVQVLTVKPGPVQTPMTEGLTKLPLLISAQKAASDIIAAMHRRRTTAYIPWMWGPIMTAIKHIPSVIFRRINL